jgi:hypothetical protein
MAEVNDREVEVFLTSGPLKGLITTRHERLSDHLANSDETFLLKNAKLTADPARGGGTASATAVVYKRSVILIVDVGSAGHRSALDAQLLRVEREPHRVLVGAGALLVRGEIHLTKGANLETFGWAQSRFIPLTHATFADRPDAAPATFIINRDQINFLMIDPVEVPSTSRS